MAQTSIKSTKNKLYLIILLLFFGMITAFILATRPQPLLLQGEVDATRIDLALRVSGRVEDLHADVGDVVKVGDTLLVLSSPQLQALLATSSANVAIAEADRIRVYSTRQELIDSAKAVVEREQSSLALARQSFDRFKELVGKGGVSQQSYDQASANYHETTKALEVAKANLDLVEKGSSDEEKALADAKVLQAKAMLEQTKTDINELTLVSPIAGRVTARIAEKGQLFNAGTPVFSITDLKNTWLTFNVREDILGDIKIGDHVVVRIPAMKNKEIEVVITVINAQGEYATWRATKATGNFDLRTFEVRAKPVELLEGLHPGMSVLAFWKR